MCSYLSASERFAEFVNIAGFGGKEEVKAKDLTDYESVNTQNIRERDQRSHYMERRRDILKKYRKGTQFVIIGLENQDRIHYAMPVRSALYDALEYTRQIKELTARNKKNKQKKSSEEFLSGLYRTDRLIPTITFVFYHGNKIYDGCTDLHDMLDLKGIGEEYRHLIPNYKMNLITLDDIDENQLHTGMREVIGAMKHSKNRDDFTSYMRANEERFERMDRETFDTISVMIGQEDLIQRRKETGEEGVYDMCQAIEEMKEEVREEGIHALVKTCKKFRVPMKDIIAEIVEQYAIPISEATEKVEKYWQN